jgi:hypothetical protein
MNALLPALHDGLLHAAVRRRRTRRRRTAATAILSLLLISGGALAASGLFGQVDRGATGGTRYTLSAIERDNQLCLQIEWSTARPAVRCDPPPATDRPFGPVLRAVSPDGRGQLLAGLVRADVQQVRVVGHGAAIPTELRRGVPGRVFVLKGHFPRVRLQALNAQGRIVAQLGTSRSTRHPLSRAQAQRQGDPAAFAPSAEMPPFTFRGRVISDRETTRRHLVCSSDTGVCVTKQEFQRQRRGSAQPPPNP